MKPPTKDWSSQHQSPSCKSSLFQTSGVLIQTFPRGQVLVRNQYSSWGGTLTHPLQRPADVWKVYLLVKGLKSLSTASSTDLPGGTLMQLPKVQNGFIMLKLNSRTFYFFLIGNFYFRLISFRQHTYSESSLSTQNGQWKDDKQFDKQHVPFYQWQHQAP